MPRWNKTLRDFCRDLQKRIKLFYAYMGPVISIFLFLVMMLFVFLLLLLLSSSSFLGTNLMAYISSTVTWRFLTHSSSYWQKSEWMKKPPVLELEGYSARYINDLNHGAGGYVQSTLTSSPLCLIDTHLVRIWIILEVGSACGVLTLISFPQVCWSRFKFSDIFYLNI